MEPVVYRVRLADRPGHRFVVQVSLPAGCNEVVFPSWAPGSYLMREFARFVRDIHAHHAGAPVPVVRTSRNVWRVSGPCQLEYSVYARDKTVRTAFLDETLAFFLPSNLCVFVPGQGASQLVVDVPAGHTAICPVAICPVGPAVTGGWTARFDFPDLDTLMDSPVSIGPFERDQFDVLGVRHEHYIEPHHNGDRARMAVDLSRIVATAAALFGDGFPYDSYQFVTLHTKNGHGGLEHKSSSILLRPRLGFADDGGTNGHGYEEFLTLAAHEHFHAWNVKRIHPVELGPTFDYANEHYTRDLWWLEGGTVYYEERVTFLAGLVTRERYLARLADLVTRLRATPGRHHQSLEDGSFDAWIKLYRANEDLSNSTVSYYLKGAVVVMCLDLELRHRSAGLYGSDDVLRTLWTKWGKQGVGYPTGSIAQVCRELAGGGDWDRWFAAHIQGTDEVAVETALDHVGCDLVAVPGKKGGWLGIELSGANVTSVREDGPSAAALSPGDELLAINDERLESGTLPARLAQIGPHRDIRVLVSRDGRLLERALRLGACPAAELKIVERNATDAGRKHVRERWLAASQPKSPFN